MAWNIDRVGAPWSVERCSIYGYIAAHLDDGGSLGNVPPELPDTVRDPNKVSYAPGA